MTGIGSWGWNYGQTAIVTAVQLETSPDSHANNTATQITNENHVNSNNDQDINSTTNSNTTNSNNTINNKNTTSNMSNNKDNHDNNNSNGTAYQIYLSTGPLAMLPLHNNLASIVWSLPTPLANEIMKLTPDALTQLLNTKFQQKISFQFKNPFLSNLYNNNNDYIPKSNNIKAILWNTITTIKANIMSNLSNNPTIIKNTLFTKVSDEIFSLINIVSEVSTFRHPFKYPPKIDTLVGDKASFPLSLQQASVYVKPRIGSL